MQTMQGTSSLTARQIKAARALLDWSQDDLAAAAELSVATIRKLELGFISPRHSTTHDIRKCFEDAGLEFIEPGGVRHRPDEITMLEGQKGLITFFDNVYQYARRNGGEILCVCPSEKPYLGLSGAKIHIERMIAIKNTISAKCLLTEDGENIKCDSYSEYRLISKHFIDSVPFYIYDNKYAIFDFDTDISPKIFITSSYTISQAFRRQFYSMWEKATPLNKSREK
jgi:transcriptional regulator with XRE-family HTH domain